MQSYLQQRESWLGFEAVRDPRGARGRRWPLPGLLATAVMSLALLARSLRRAEQLSEELCECRRLRRLGVRRRVPDSTLGDALSQVAPAELLAELHRQVRAEHRRRALRPVLLPVGVVAIDGKTQAVLDKPANPFTCQRQTSEHGECRKFRVRRSGSDCRKRSTTCRTTRTTKGPRPVAEHERPAARDESWQCDSSRGWVRRELYVSSELAGWPGWEHLRQVWLVRI